MAAANSNCADWLRTLDTLGSVSAIDAPVEAICWTHRGSGWDVHYTAEHPYSEAELPRGRGVKTKNQAYALVREMREAWHRASYLQFRKGQSEK